MVSQHYRIGDASKPMFHTCSDKSRVAPDYLTGTSRRRNTSVLGVTTWFIGVTLEKRKKEKERGNKHDSRFHEISNDEADAFRIYIYIYTRTNTRYLYFIDQANDITYNSMCVIHRVGIPTRIYANHEISNDAVYRLRWIDNRVNYISCREKKKNVSVCPLQRINSYQFSACIASHVNRRKTKR